MDFRRTAASVSLIALVCAGCSTPARLRTHTPLVPIPAETLAGQVEVIRTDYGVPHIYADNFKALGYALGYLQLEDYGSRVPGGMLRARGELARYIGRGALDSDFENGLGYRRATEVYFQLSQDTRDVYEGFAAGVNRYIDRYREEFPPWMRAEFTGYDVASLYLYRPNPREVRRWVQRIQQADQAPLLKLDAKPAQSSRLESGITPAPFPDDWNDGSNPSLEAGSSAWALAPSRTTANATILMRNPHLGWDAGYWEIHAVIPDRLDFYGDFRIGGPLGIIGGFNRHLGFATTNNSVDDAEVYALRSDPEREDHYLFDGSSMPLRREVLTRAYRDGGELFEETREKLYTHLGPVISRKHGLIYIIRTPRDGEFRAGEQFLRLIQARNLQEWKNALRLLAHPGSSFTYADRWGNIFYIWNAAIPVRPHPAGDTLAVPATRTAEVWTEIHDLESLPQLQNPEGGYLHDENDGPWLANMYEPLDPADYPEYFEENEFGLRSQHSVLLLHNEQRFSLEDVVRLKHSYRMLLADRVKDDLIRAVEAGLTPEDADTSLASATELLKRWDNTASPQSRGSVLFTEWWRIYTEALRNKNGNDVEVFAEPWAPEIPADTPRGLADPALAASLFGEAIAQTARRFGTWDVAWGKVHRVRRGGIDLPVGGCPGALGCFRVLNFTEDTDGTRRVSGGDGWTIAVEFTDPPRAYSILGYGQSGKADSPHHADQVGLFARGEMKPVFYTQEDVLGRIIRRYRPGLEAVIESD